MISPARSKAFGKAIRIALFVALLFTVVHAAPPPEVQLTPTGQWPDIWAVAVAGNYAYVLDGHYLSLYDQLVWGSQLLKVLDVSDPSHPVEIGSLSLQSLSTDITVAGHLLFVRSESSGVEIVDVIDPRRPVSMGKFGEGQTFFDAAVQGSHVFLLASQKLYILEINKAGSAVLVSTLELEESSLEYYGRLAASSGVVFLSRASEQTSVLSDWVVDIIDVSDPTLPTLLNTLEVKDWISDLAIFGDYLYLAAKSGLDVVNISDPRKPLSVAHYGTPDFAMQLKVSGSLVYLASGMLDDWFMPNDPGSELRVIDVSNPATPILVNGGPIQDLGGFASLGVANDHLFVWNHWNMQTYAITRVPRILGTPQLAGNQLRLTFAASPANTFNFRVESAELSVAPLIWNPEPDAVIKASDEPGILEAILAPRGTARIYRISEAN